LSPIFLFMLSAANFVVGFGAFVVIGLVEPIAARFDVTPSLAGNTMTAYALAYAVGSPLAIALTGSLPRRTILIAAMSIFALGSLLSAFAPSLPLLFAARVLAAFGAGLFTPIAAAVGAALVPPEQRARTLSTIFAGLTIAQVVGVPAGTWLGYSYGPAMTFYAVAALAVLAVIGLLIVLPKDIRLAPTSLAALGSVLATPRLVVAVTFSASFLTAIYVLYTYLGPLMTHLYGLDKDAKTVMFLIYGSAAVAGNFLGSAGVQKVGAFRTLLFLSFAQAILLLAIPNLAFGVVATALLLAAWALLGWSFMTPQQTRLVTISPQQVQPLFALNASCIYAAAALGSAIGGFVLNHGGFPMIGVVAAIVMLVAAAHLVLSKKLAGA
jgi:MFS transporter, DHA1 family, inner membrane transport protein